MINKIFKNTKYVLIILLIQALNCASAAHLCHNFLHKHYKSSQLLYVKLTKDFHGKLYICEKNKHTWQLKKIIPVVLGRNGIIAAEKKKEGDGFTPTGSYKLGPAFGQIDITTKLQFIKLTKQHKWIDDPNSLNYNQLILGATKARSYENMYIPEYKLGIVVQYNMHPVLKHRGSAIFIHVWQNPHTPTAGCIAMSQSNLIWLLKWIKKNQNVFITT